MCPELADITSFTYPHLTCDDSDEWESVTIRRIEGGRLKMAETLIITLPVHFSVLLHDLFASKGFNKICSVNG
jgi:hypothetical protein